MCKDDLKEKSKLPPGSIFLNIRLPDQDYLDSLISSADFEKQMQELDTVECSKRAERMKWTFIELPKRSAKATSLGYPVGPWVVPYDQAQNCYVYGFYRATIAMVGSIAESICVTLLHKLLNKTAVRIGKRDKRYEDMTLGELITEIKKDVFLENISRLKEIKDIRNKWLHIKSDDWFTDMELALEKEESATRADAEKILTLIHEVLGSVFEIRPADNGTAQIHINAQRKHF